MFAVPFQFFRLGQELVMGRAQRLFRSPAPAFPVHEAYRRADNDHRPDQDYDQKQAARLPLNPDLLALDNKLQFRGVYQDCCKDLVKLMVEVRTDSGPARLLHPDHAYRFQGGQQELYLFRLAPLPLVIERTRNQAMFRLPAMYQHADQIDGPRVVFPDFLHVDSLVPRKDLLEAKGLKVPETWDEYLAAAQALNNPPEVYGTVIGASAPSYTTQIGTGSKFYRIKVN